MFQAILIAMMLSAGEAHYLDLAPIANASPLSEEDLYEPGINAPAIPYIWMEGEKAQSTSRPLPAESASRASQGKTLGGAFAGRADDWAEWYFDVPWQIPHSRHAWLYLRTARVGQNAFTTLRVTLNGEDRGEIRIPINEGWGEDDDDFAVGLCSIDIGRVELGRQVLRLSAGDTAEAVHIDGFWMAPAPLDIINRINDQGRIYPVASIYNLVYRFGAVARDHVPYLLLDPEDNDHRAIFVTAEEKATIAGDDQRGASVSFLGAGIRGPVTVPIELEYKDGRVERKEITLGPLYSKEGDGAAMRMGRYRYAYGVRCPLDAQAALREIRLGKPSGRYVLIAATLLPTINKESD